MENVIPTHQGRSAEFLLMQALAIAKGDVVIGNTHFDTTRANIEHSGAEAVDLPCAETADTQSEAPFKGNIDLRRPWPGPEEGAAPRAARHHHGDEQLRGRPARLDGEHPGGAAHPGSPAGFRSSSTRPGSRRTPSSSRSGRRGSKEPGRARHRAGDVLPLRRCPDEREKGCVRKHRRLSRHPRPRPSPSRCAA